MGRPVFGQEEEIPPKQSFIEYFLVPDSTHRFRFKFAPVITAAPETKLTFGVTVVLNWDWKKKLKGTFPSFAQTTFVYSLNKQMRLLGDYDIFTNHNRFNLKGQVGILRFPQYYYGVGNNIDAGDRELVDYNRIYLRLRNRYHIIHGINIGLAWFFNDTYNVSWDLGDSSKFAHNSELVGSEGYLVSGLGPEVVYDTRSNPSNPLTGSYLNFTYLYYGKYIGSGVNFHMLEFDFSHYIPVNREKYWLIGINIYSKLALGSVPFDELPGLGNDKIMRGYYNGRFRDNSYFAIQAEWRMLIWRFIGAVAWVGTGQVGARMIEYTWNGFKPNYGLGLRIQFDKKSRANIRVDFGFGQDENGFYLSVNEAF